MSRVRAAYKALADDLRDYISIYGEADRRLPTEAELARQHGLSRQTVRRAYQELVEDGIVQRTPGRGTFPAERGPYVRSVGSLDSLLAQSEDTEVKVVEPLVIVDAAPPDVVTQLQTEPLMRMVTVRSRDGMPISAVIIWIPLEIGVQLANAAFVNKPGARQPTTVLEMLDRVLNRPIATAQQVISATEVPRAIAPLIDCQPGERVLRIDRLFLDNLDKRVEFAINFCNPHRYKHQIELRRTKG